MSMKKLTGVAILLSTFGAAHAATDAELSVIGTIKAPACDVAMLNNGVAAFGKIGRNLLSATASTPIGNKQVDLTVTCEADTLLAVKVTDNRAVDKPAGTMQMSFADSTVPGVSGSFSQTQLMGLGKSTNSLPIGAYVLAFGKPVVDRVPATYISSNNTGGTAYANYSGSVLYFDSATARYFGAADSTANFTQRGKVHFYPMAVAASIDKSGNIPGDQDVELDGNATIEVVYL